MTSNYKPYIKNIIQIAAFTKSLNLISKIMFASISYESPSDVIGELKYSYKADALYYTVLSSLIIYFCWQSFKVGITEQDLA